MDVFTASSTAVYESSFYLLHVFGSICAPKLFLLFFLFIFIYVSVFILLFYFVHSCFTVVLVFIYLVIKNVKHPSIPSVCLFVLRMSALVSCFFHYCQGVHSFSDFLLNIALSVCYSDIVLYKKTCISSSFLFCDKGPKTLGISKL